MALKRRPGNRGRVDERFIHSVRSQLPIRGKHSDHRAAVEALVAVLDRIRYAARNVGADSCNENAWSEVGARSDIAPVAVGGERRPATHTDMRVTET